MIKESTCYKTPNNPKWIGLMLTITNRSFQNSGAIETGLRDFHKTTVSVLKCYFTKAEPKVIFYRDYKNFSSMYKWELGQKPQNKKNQIS